MTNAAQHTLDWYRARLGKITGSRVGDLMKSGRSKTETFGETAKSYIYQVAAEREMNPAIVNDDELFELYLEQTGFTSKAIRWGNEQEANARDLYIKKTGRKMVEVGIIEHPTIANFGSSPDGFFYENGDKGTLEIKCPNQNTFMRYKDCVKDNETLLETESKYYYQCMAHMMCSGSLWTDFVVYFPFQSKPDHIVRIYPDESVFENIRERIELANKMIEQIINIKK